ncbi:MAG: hypothetical protein CM1200mP39_26900 [Dehalococcoidia bacterium]|nr:MAG: hypothetical protein CM1200mP39_26900 [Dehalococcoidia bacterium]
MLGVEGNLHEGLGLSKDWAYNIVSQVGNYDEVYEAYMGGGELGIGIARAGVPKRTLDSGWPDVFAAFPLIGYCYKKAEKTKGMRKAHALLLL